MFFLCNFLDSIDFFCVWTKAAILVKLQDCVINNVLSFYVITSSAKCIGSAIIASGRVFNIELVLSEEFSLSGLSSVQDLRCRKS